tara:strand:- start:183 stop:1292 length:1110 start_codon:yes stop_codon:yes gene_type:complete
MTNLSFNELDNAFRNNDFPKIENDLNGIKFLKLRSMSRKTTMEEFCLLQKISLEGLKSKQYFNFLFENPLVDESKINDFINEKYKEEAQSIDNNTEYIVDQLNRLNDFDWGGSFGNSLEKNIVNNYVKKIQSFDQITEKINEDLLFSLKGYTMNSWYNHWTSILIENIFKNHNSVLPTVGLIKKIDFFINDIPFDLKVTYFPEQLLKEKLKESNYGNELTMLKRICRELQIFIPTDLKDKALKTHLYKKVSEDHRSIAKEFISDLKAHKKNIILSAEKSPSDLKRWFYENQGEARFDASNRFFLVLTDENDMINSWKLKRNINFLREKINDHLDNLVLSQSNLETEFFWKKDKKTYKCKSDILFIKYGL